GTEAAGAVEGFKVRLEIDMQPGRALVAGKGRRFGDECGGDALAAPVRIDAGIKDEGVVAAVPGDVDESDECVAGIGADMAEPALEDRVEIMRSRITPRDLPQTAQRRVGGEGATAQRDFGRQS